MNLNNYVAKNARRGACQCGKCFDAPLNPEKHQPVGHTVDLLFFKVAKNGDAKKEEFEKIAKAEFSHWFDGKEHSYLEMGADMGDQGIALMTMGLGKLLNIWELLTPESLMPFLPQELKMQMAGQGLISIQFKQGGGKHDQDKTESIL